MPARNRPKFIDMPNPYPSNQGYIRNALDRPHREIAELQEEIAELRDLLKAKQGVTP